MLASVLNVLQDEDFDVFADLAPALRVRRESPEPRDWAQRAPLPDS